MVHISLQEKMIYLYYSIILSKYSDSLISENDSIVQICNPVSKCEIPTDRLEILFKKCIWTDIIILMTK